MDLNLLEQWGSLVMTAALNKLGDNPQCVLSDAEMTYISDAVIEAMAEAAQRHSGGDLLVRAVSASAPPGVGREANLVVEASMRGARESYSGECE